jgi:ribosomal protein S26
MIMGQERKTFVVCVYRKDEHSADAKEVKCSQCGAPLWCSPHNLGLSPLCIQCFEKIPPAEAVIMVKMIDLIKASIEIVKRKMSAWMN